MLYYKTKKGKGDNMTSEKREEISKILNEQTSKVKGTYNTRPAKYSEIFPDGGKGRGWSRHYVSPEDKKTKEKVKVYTTEKGIEEMEMER